MIAPISFTSTYKVNNKNKEGFEQFQKFAYEQEYEDGTSTLFKDSVGLEYPYNYEAEQTLIVPDYNDSFVESYCAFHNIKFKKYKTDELMDSKAVKSRVQEAPKGFRKVNLNVKKLENLIGNQRSNIDYCENDYRGYYRKEIDTILKSGEDFPATTLYVSPTNGDKEELKTYVNAFGLNLNSGQVEFDFSQKTDIPDHCIFFALRDLGMEKIPMYVNHSSYVTGKILKLFS